MWLEKYHIVLCNVCLYKHILVLHKHILVLVLHYALVLLLRYIKRKKKVCSLKLIHLDLFTCIHVSI